MILRAEIKFIKQPQVGDYIEFDLKSNGVSSLGNPVKIVFNNTATSTTLGESKIGSTIYETANTLRLKLSTYYYTSIDGSIILYTGPGSEEITLLIYYNTSGYASFGFNSVPGIGELVEVKKYITNTVSNTSGFLAALSPYYIIYNQTNPYDKISVDLNIWKGSINNKTIEPNYQFIKYKTNYNDTTTSINIAQIVRSFLEPKLTNSWTAGTNLNGGFDECCYVEWVCYGLLDILNIDGEPTGEALLVSTLSDRKIALLGYGYFEEGANPVITNPLSSLSEYITLGDDEFVAVGSTGATSTDLAIVRTKNPFRGTCEGIYKPYQVVYLNKNGVFVGFSFPKLSKRVITSKTDSFERLLNKPYQYSTIDHYTRVLNKTEKLKYTLNTALLSENDVKYIKELIQSEKHYLIYEDNIIPVILKDFDFEVKNRANNKAKIQYTIEFDSANEVKNNIQ